MTKSYLEVEYADRPRSTFPTALMQYIRQYIWQPSSVADVGSGTGDFLAAWNDGVTRLIALDTSPVGLRDSMKRHFHPYDFVLGPRETAEPIAELVFSKSVVEHQRNVPRFLAHLAAMSSRYVVVMAPDWETTSLTFYDDPTHVSPCTPAGLKMAAEMAGLKVIKVEKVMQTEGLLFSGRQRALGRLFGAICPQSTALWLEKVTGNPWFRWAKQKAILMVAIKG